MLPYKGFDRDFLMWSIYGKVCMGIFFHVTASFQILQNGVDDSQRVL